MYRAHEPRRHSNYNSRIYNPIPSNRWYFYSYWKLRRFEHYRYIGFTPTTLFPVLGYRHSHKRDPRGTAHSHLQGNNGFEPRHWRDDRYVHTDSPVNQRARRSVPTHRAFLSSCAR